VLEHDPTGAPEPELAGDAPDTDGCDWVWETPRNELHEDGHGPDCYPDFCVGGHPEPGTAHLYRAPNGSTMGENDKTSQDMHP